MFMMLRRIFWIGFVLGGKNGKDGRRKTEDGRQNLGIKEDVSRWMKNQILAASQLIAGNWGNRGLLD